MNSTSITLTNNAIKIYGDAAIAGVGVGTRLISMGSLTVFGFIKGFRFGAKKFDRLRSAIKISVLRSTVFYVIVWVLFVLFPTQIVAQFSKDDTQMIEIGAKALRANRISFMLFGFHTVYLSLFLALGKGKEGFILEASRQGICFIPLILILPTIMQIDRILYSQPIEIYWL